ncbi:uncharacterized protein LOC123671054 [Harmonia axyridis]|uniref:uncharacterized protein LOC123671054 n=1 Tax=Harmonia axyridis TaxID=115357 RepID=UPI001E2750E5|nr:uncharacterized protein LOC123671054 [Harmonia axyridis]XP_045460660.1 uncharacterized protein LOC123671054 [Harmonia axyridis]
MEACLGYSAQGNGNRDADSTQKKTVAGEYSDLIEYMKTYNCEITEDLLERISKKNSNSNGITDPKIVMMTALFEKFCSAGYEVHKVTPYMSVNYPYCRWIVEYESLYEYNHYGESEHVLTMCKPPQVFPVYVPHNTVSFRGKRLMQFGVKHCACVKPTEQFVSGFNMIHNTYALYDMR